MRSRGDGGGCVIVVLQQLGDTGVRTLDWRREMVCSKTEFAGMRQGCPFEIR